MTKRQLVTLRGILADLERANTYEETAGAKLTQMEARAVAPALRGR